MIEWLGTSHFSFLEGASSPHEMMECAHRLGYAGFALADRMGLYGAVQAQRAARIIRSDKDDLPSFAENETHVANAHFFYAPGIRLHFDAADPIFIYPLHRKAHAVLCTFLSEWALEGMSHSEKGLTPLPWGRFRDFLRTRKASLALDYVIISVSGRFYPWVESPKESTRVRTQDAKAPTPTFCNPPTAPGLCPFWLIELAELCGRGPDSALSLAYPLTLSPGCEDLVAWLEEQSQSLRIPLLATSLPLFAIKEEQDLCDLLTAIRHSKKLSELGFLQQANGERRLLAREERNFFEKRIVKKMQNGKLSWNPITRGLDLATRHGFSLAELQYKYPSESVPQGHTARSFLAEIVWKGARERYNGDLPSDISKQVQHELDLVGQLGFEDYFLTIWDILRYAREQKILFQGRGSAANSAICYCLGITAINPVQMDLLFERFISLERNEPPDIDVDFEHERREEVMQEVYRRYGRKRAAMVASVISFQGRMAIRETGKALGLDPETLNQLAAFMGREGMSRMLEHPQAPPRELQIHFGAKPIAPTLWRKLLALAPRLVGTPRHLGLHTGGFVLSDIDLVEQCILEPARMENRSVIPWDKDDVEELKWMKVDLLSLGILTALRKTFDLVHQTQKIFNPEAKPLSLSSISLECDDVYKAMCRADTVGVFQIESRAQMNMLPRLAPKKFYDVVIEVAIVRPGPIQGGMVHPYLQRRQDPRLIQYDHPDLEPILKKTHGIPIFQEQVMKMASAVAGFTPGESDQLRKVMSGAWRSKSSMRKLQKKLHDGMRAKGLSEEYANRIYKQIEGFGDYGFPESHAASFAILTYVSAWLKVHQPSEFLCALLNSQPMGFYSPRALVADAERHKVRVLPINALHSKWDSTLELNPFEPSKPFVRLGFHLIKGFTQDEARLVEDLQAQGILSSEHESLPHIQGLREAGVPSRILQKLIAANALRALETRSSRSIDPRRTQTWHWLQSKQHNPDAPKLALEKNNDPTFLPQSTEWETLMQDYLSVGMRTKDESHASNPLFHPAQYARQQSLHSKKWVLAEELYQLPDRKRIDVIGLLSSKQRPPTAGGMCFITLEDETGFLNLAVLPKVYERDRLIIDSGRILAASVTLQRSPLSNPGDPHSTAIILMVDRLWNPFLATSTSVPQLGSVRAYR